MDIRYIERSDYEKLVGEIRRAMACLMDGDLLSKPSLLPDNPLRDQIVRAMLMSLCGASVMVLPHRPSQCFDVGRFEPGIFPKESTGKYKGNL